MTQSDNATCGWLVATPAEARRHSPTPCLLSPLTARLPPALADLGSSLPIGDANGELLAALRGDPLPRESFAGVLANDPFRLADDLLETLAELGCPGVANWPTTALLSGELAEAMLHSGLGYETEMALLARARERGFQTLAVVATQAQLASALAARPSRLLLAAGLASAGGESAAQAGQALPALLERARAEGQAVWLYEHAGVAEIMAELRARADGVIRHPGAG